MVSVTNSLDIGKEEAISIFDVISKFSFGSGTASPKVSDTILANELYKNIIYESTKNISETEYEITGRLPIGQANSNVISEVGIYSNTDNLSGRAILPVTLSKIEGDEYLVTLRIKANVINI
jgi:hypothetical protein